MTLKVYKNNFAETVFQTILYKEKIQITGFFLLTKVPDQDLYPDDPKRPDPDLQH